MHLCIFLARQKEDRISPLFFQNNATFQKEGENLPIEKAAKYILILIYAITFQVLFSLRVRL
jgi:hypothetical protein